MICGFCGSENRADNKFCGMCGVRLDQRKAERRVANATALKCPGCGHLNDPGYKFCGMCGTRVERRKGERRGSAAEPRAAAAANAQLPTPEAAPSRRPPERRAQAARYERRPDETVPQEQPASFFKSEHYDQSIHGPSFLGLSDAPETESTYMLEEEEPSGRGLRLIVLLAVLAAIIGLLVVQWRSGFKASPKPQPQQNEPAPEKPQGANQQPANQDPMASPASPSSFADGGKQILDRAFGNHESPSAANGTVSADSSRPADSITVDDKGATARGLTFPDGKLTGAKSSSPYPTATPVLDLASRKPSPMLLKAQQYLQGTGGVRQNCEQGLVYLRAAAQKNDPAAAVQMGALYSSGHCVQRDAVQAWRWFNSAREQEPANQLIKTNMDRLWASMTEQERRQAAR
jgi:double zinc ribbon protein/Sel1 repeat-containing protein